MLESWKGAFGSFRFKEVRGSILALFYAAHLDGE